MKRFLFLLPFSFFLLPFLSLPFGEGWGGAFSQGYVTLQGRQFYDHQGNPFYPVVVNYGVNLPHINDGNTSLLSNFEIAPDGSIGGTNGYDHPAFDKGADRILVDFLKIKSMGFNAVRLLHIVPGKTDGGGFSLTSAYYPRELDPEKMDSNITLNITAPYASDNILQNIVLPKIKQVLDLAQQAGLKIILLSGGYVANNDANAQDYAAFLAVLSDYFKTHPALLAYDIYNEPHWSAVGADCCGFTRDKRKVCEYTRQWYDSIKANDNNHLVTIGAVHIFDALDWDPYLIKVDFLSQHIYPDLYKYENWSLQTALERTKGLYYWIYSNLQVPWIIGETGFPAGGQDSDTGDVASCCNKQPYIWGQYSDQTYYAQQSQQITLNYGGSGYTWWDFQHKNWFGWADSLNYHQNFFGLLKYGDPVYNPVTQVYEYPASLNKPLVDIAFGSNIPTVPNGPPDMPSNYYNPFNHPANPANTVTGTISDQNGNPVKDALIIGHTYLTVDIPITSKNEAEFDTHYTFTDDNGNFNFIAYDYKFPFYDVDSHPLEGKIIDYAISALGSERLYSEWCPGCVPLSINPILKKASIVNDVAINNTTVTAGNTQNFNGWSTLTANNIAVQPGASSDITAAREIHITGESHLQGETHIFTSPSFIDCNDAELGDFLMQERKGSVVEENNSVITIETKQIEVSFRKKSSTVSVVPGNNRGLFLVQLHSEEENSVLRNIAVYDLLGRKIISSMINDKFYFLELSGFPGGIYLLQANDSENIYNKKIIVK